MNKTIKFLNTLSLILSGMTLSSILITESETWKISLPFCLLCLVLSNNLKER